LHDFHEGKLTIAQCLAVQPDKCDFLDFHPTVYNSSIIRRGGEGGLAAAGKKTEEEAAVFKRS
jgi:hypothetical protein